VPLLNYQPEDSNCQSNIEILVFSLVFHRSNDYQPKPPIWILTEQSGDGIVTFLSFSVSFSSVLVFSGPCNLRHGLPTMPWLLRCARGTPPWTTHSAPHPLRLTPRAACIRRLLPRLHRRCRQEL
jgi:hypothetical protein